MVRCGDTRRMPSHALDSLRLPSIFPGTVVPEGEPSSSAKGYAGWLLAYLSLLGEPVHLVGHSMGALVVLEAAAARPDFVRSVTLVGVSDRMPVNPDLLAGAAEGDLSMFATMGKWMHARDPIGDPEWTVDDTVAILQRARPGVAYADLTACNTYPGAAAIAAGVSRPDPADPRRTGSDDETHRSRTNREPLRGCDHRDRRRRRPPASL